MHNDDKYLVGGTGLLHCQTSPRSDTLMFSIDRDSGPHLDRLDVALRINSGVPFRRSGTDFKKTFDEFKRLAEQPGALQIETDDPRLISQFLTTLLLDRPYLVQPNSVLFARAAFVDLAS